MWSLFIVAEANSSMLIANPACFEYGRPVTADKWIPAGNGDTEHTYGATSGDHIQIRRVRRLKNIKLLKQEQGKKKKNGD